MSNTIFSKNLRKLREEMKISQKSAAASLGISQALLSHYEKGIRECGLNFLTRAAKFYKVSTDYMLGISDNIDDNIYNNNPVCFKNKIKDCELKKDGKEYNISSALYKNLLVNAISHIFDNMRETDYKEISVLSGKYISLSVYCLYIMLRDVLKEKNPFEDYNFENPYLNIIINGVDIKI
ncbi:MAG: helix-turn-helix transcriptional regulator [Oscillospiraceae bacterium]|nr:helix-turn-helix transcriptional regulator [Oscillospiraceae bacterium]